MNWRTKIGKCVALVLLLGGVGASLGFAIPWMKNWLSPNHPTSTPGKGESGPRLLGTDLFSVPADVAKSLGVRVVPVSPPTRFRGLAPLPGSLALDPNRMARVHARFPGEVVELGAVQHWPTLAPPLLAAAPGGWCPALTLAAAPARPLAFGDHVERGQLLAVVWNKDLVEKKWELVDALSQRRLEEKTFARLEKLWQEAAVPLARVEESRRTLAQSRAAVARAEVTLRAWRLTEHDLAEVYAEEKRLHEEGAVHERQRPVSWARVEVRAPLAGTILEKNVIAGDIVDTATDLFKIADLSILAIHAHLYEEDLPYLLKMPGAIPWDIHLKSDPAAAAVAGTVRNIGKLVDPQQRTVLLTGELANPDGRLRPGQFVTARVRLPASQYEVEIPTTALLEDGEESVVLIQPQPGRPEYHLRRVQVLRRYQDIVIILAGDADRFGTLRQGEWVVASGALELRNLLAVLQGAAPGGK